MSDMVNVIRALDDKKSALDQQIGRLEAVNSVMNWLVEWQKEIPGEAKIDLLSRIDRLK